MTTTTILFLAVWALSAGHNLATVKNYGLFWPIWIAPAVMGGPFITLLLFALIRSSDELQEKRQFLANDRRVKRIRSEDRKINRLLE